MRPPPTRRKKSSKHRLLPPGATKEEDAQLDALRNPWSLSYGDFLKLVKERHGYTEHETFAIDPTGKKVRMPYLRSADGERTYELPGNLVPEDQLDEYLTGNLCRRIEIPPQEFGLPEEEAYDESCEFDLDAD
jgi:hypothetical protein